MCFNSSTPVWPGIGMVLYAGDNSGRILPVRLDMLNTLTDPGADEAKKSRAVGKDHSANV